MFRQAAGGLPLVECVGERVASVHWLGQSPPRWREWLGETVVHSSATCLGSKGLGILQIWNVCMCVYIYKMYVYLCMRVHAYWRDAKIEVCLKSLHTCAFVLVKGCSPTSASVCERVPTKAQLHTPSLSFFKRSIILSLLFSITVTLNVIVC